LGSGKTTSSFYPPVNVIIIFIIPFLKVLERIGPSPREKIILVESMNDLTAKEIAIAIDDVGRCPCGNTATAIFECESTNCGSNFCFLCMQKYIHGRTIIPHKFCEPHFHSEVKCMELDRQFKAWEKKTATAIWSVSITKWLIKTAPILKLFSIVTGLLILAGGAMFLVAPSEGVTTDDAYTFLMMGPVVSAGGFIWRPMFSAFALGAEKALDALLGKMPNNDPRDRPILPGRELPIFTVRVVENYFSME
jgi:hypothetical protein